MSYYSDYSVTIYFTGYPDYLVTVIELDNEFGTTNVSFCKEELNVSVDLSGRPFSL